MAKALNVSLAVTADTSQAKAQLQQLQQSLQQLTTSSANLKIGLNANELKEASALVTELGVHLKQATNVDTGTLNFAKLSTSIKSSGMSLKEYGAQLLRLGPQGQQAFTQLASSIAKAEIPIRRLSSLLGNMGTVLANTVRWQISSSIIHGFMSSVSQAFSYAQDLNKSLIDIQIVTQASDEHMAKFAEQANKAAKALNTTTTAYTKASLIYYQQGLNDQQVKERTDVTVKMANITGQSAQIVSDQLTAIWNNFAKGGQNLEYYADVITALGAATASSSEEISKGLEKFASIADTVGLSYENATAALATITATTRQSADTVGTGLRTLFSRLQSVSLGETLEDGVNLTKYSKALKTIGVDVLDAAGKLREMDDILEDMGTQWDKLTDAQKTATAQTVGGVRQYTTLMALMENFDFYKQNQQVAKNAEGTVQAQADIYAKSWEASQKRVKASAEAIYSNLISDKFFINLNNGFAKFLDIINNIINGLGGLKGVLSSVGAVALKIFSNEAAAGLVNFGNNLRTIFANPQTLRQEQTDFINWGADQLAGRGATEQESAFARHQLELQAAYAKNAMKMTSTDRMVAQAHIDNYTRNREDYGIIQRQLEQSKDRAGDLRSTLVSQSEGRRIQAAVKEYNKTGIGGDPYLKKAAQQGYLDFYGGKFSFKAIDYYKDLGKALDTNLIQPLTNFEKQKDILKNWADDSSEGIKKLSQELEKAGLTDAEKFLEGAEDGSFLKGGKEELIQSLKDSTEGNIQENITNLTDQWGFSTETVEKYRAAIQAAAGDEQKLAAIVKQMAQDEQNAANATNKKNKQMQIAEGITSLAQGMMSIGAASSSLQGIVSTIQQISEGAISAGDAFTSLTSGIGSMVMMGIMGFNALSTAAAAFNVALSTGPLIAITAIMVLLPTIIKAIGNVMPETNEEKIARLVETADKAKESANESKQAYNDLLSNVSSHNELLNEINSLTAGTKEFTEALQEANIIASGLISTYGLQLGKDYTFENGKIIFNEDSIKTITAAAQNWSYLQEFRAGLAQYQYSSTNDSVEREDQRWDRTNDINGWASTHSNEADFITHVQSSLKDDFDQMYFDNQDAFKSKGIDYETFMSNTNLYQHSMDEIQSYLNGFDFLSNWSNEWGLTKNNILSATLDNYWSGDWGGYAWGSDKTIGAYGSWQNLLADRESIVNPSMENTVANRTFGQDQYTQILTSIANFQDGISDAEGFAIEALTDAFNTDEFDSMMSEIENAEDLNFINIADAKDKFTKELSAEQLKLLENDEEYQKLDEKGKIQKLKDTIILNRKRQAIEKQFANEVAQFENTNILNKYADLENQTLSELSEINTEGLNSDEINQLTKLQNSYRGKIEKAANQVLKAAFGEDTKFKPEDWDITAKDWLKAEDIFSNFSTLLKKDFEDISFSQKMGELLFDESTKQINQGLLSALSSVDTSSNLSALLDLKRYSGFSQFSGVSSELNQLYETGLEAIGGKAGILEELYGTVEFQDSLKDLQKQFKKTGKISSQNILDAADSCEILNDVLENTELSAGAIAGAIELMSTGAVSSISEINNAVLKVLGTINAFADSLANAFKYIDEWNSHLDRSTQDLSDHFSKISKDIFELLGEGNVGGERLYQQLTGMFGEQYAAGMRQFFIDQETGANKDNPEARQKAYNERYGEIDKWIQQAQKEGNNRALWEGMLSGAMDSEITGLSERLQGAGLSLGEGNDIELDTQGRTTTQMQAALAQAMGIDFNAAGVWLQELAGHSASITQDLKTNDYLAAASQVAQLEGADRNLANLALARTTDQTTLDAAQARLEQQRAEAQRIADNETASDTDRANAEDTLAKIEAQETALKEVQQAHEDIAKDQQTVLDNADETAGIYKQLSDTSKEVSQNILNSSKTAITKTPNGTTREREMVDAQQLMDYYQSLGMSAEQAWETTKQAYQNYGDQARDARENVAAFGVTAEDAYGNVKGVTLDAQATLEDFNEAQKQLAIDIKHSENQELGKDLFKGMVTAASEMQGQLQEITGIDAVINLTVDADTSAAQGKISEVTSSIEGAIGTIKIDGNNEGAETAGDDAATYINGLSGTVTIDGNTGPFESAMSSILNQSYSVDVNINLTGVSSGAIITAATNAAKARYGSKALGGLIQSNAFGSANRSVAPGLSLTAEEGPEVVWNKNDGYAYLVGGNGHPEFVMLRPGDRIFNANQTREILNYNRPDSNYFNSILKPENMDQRLFGSFAEGSAYGSYGPNSTYGRSGGGNNQKTKDFTPERYHVITRQIQDLTFWYEELKKAREKAYGTNILDAIDKELKGTEELVKAQEALVKEAEHYREVDLQRLKDLGISFELDENGNIRNWEELQEKYRKAAEQNKDDTAAKERWDAIQQYEETLDKWQEAYAEFTDLRLQAAELLLEKITTKVDLKIDFDERDLKLIEHFTKKIDDNIYDTARVLQLAGLSLDKINDKIDTTRQGINEIFENMTDSKGNQITDMTLEKFLSLSEAERDALDINHDFGKQLEEYSDDLLDYIEDLKDFKTKGIDELNEAFNELNDNIQSSMDLFNYYQDTLDNLKNIIDLQGVTISKDLRDVFQTINQTLLSNNANNIQTELVRYEKLRDVVADLQNKLLTVTDPILQKEWENQLKEAEEALRNSQTNLLTLWQDGLDMAKQVFEQNIDNAVREFEEQVAGAYGNLNGLQAAYDRRKEIDDFYVDDYEKYYQISKLQRQINKDLNDAAKNHNKNVKGLNILFNDLNDAREAGVELTAYDLDIFAKRYAYEKALMDLEDSRNAKQQVRLQRDANGNWGYVYTAAEDDDDLIHKQQAVEDALYEWQKATTAEANRYSDEILPKIRANLEAIAEAYKTGSDIPQNILNDTKELLSLWGPQFQKSLEDGAQTLNIAIDRYKNASFDIFDNLNESGLAAVLETGEGIDQLLNILTSQMDIANDEMNTASINYKNQVDNLNNFFKEYGDSLGTVINAWAQAIGEDSEENKANTSQMIENAKLTFDEILLAANEFEDKFMEKYEPIISRNEQFIIALNEALDALNRKEFIQGQLLPYIGSYIDPSSFASGGFTGAWGSGGRLAILHEKENVFNADDTHRLLNAANILRSIDLSINSFAAGFGNILLPKLTPIGNSLDQNVHIEASFPNVIEHNEIELAFDNLINKASQYANRKNMSSMTFQDMYTDKF